MRAFRDLLLCIPLLACASTQRAEEPNYINVTKPTIEVPINVYVNSDSFRWSKDLLTVNTIYKDMSVKFYVVKVEQFELQEYSEDTDHILRRMSKTPTALNIFYLNKVVVDEKVVAGAYVQFPETHFIVISDASARHKTLAHEISHFFGLEHVEDNSNIMFSGYRTVGASFTNEQKSILIKNITVYIFDISLAAPNIFP